MSGISGPWPIAGPTGSASTSASSSAAAGPSSFASTAAPLPFVVKKKRGRFSDGKTTGDASHPEVPAIVQPRSPQMVPRNSSSASSWGVEELSDSDGDYDWSHYAAVHPVSISQEASRSLPSGLRSPDLNADDLVAFSRPAKRAHLETAEDRHTYGQLAGLQIDPSAFGSSLPAHGRPISGRTNSGLTGAFGLGSSLSSSLLSGVSGTAAPPVPPSSPTKSANRSATLDGFGAPSLYRQTVMQAPPTSPTLAARGSLGIAPPASPSTEISALIPTKHANSLELEDSVMRIRKAPSSYEVEPDRIVVTSLDDTSPSSASDDGASEADDDRTPDADTSTESASKESSEFVINNELIEKLEAHRRAVLTGTSDRDNAASSSSRAGGSGSPSGRSRRSGRRSGGGGTGNCGGGLSNLGSMLSSRRRSAQSSASSSGYASPINTDDARGALVLWKDPEEVLRVTSTSVPTSSSPLKPALSSSSPSSLMESSSVPAASADFMSQPPVSFSSGSVSVSARQAASPDGSLAFGFGGASSPATSVHGADSPLYAQQSSLSSSYFPATSSLESHLGSHTARPAAQTWASFGQTSSGSEPQPFHTHYPLQQASLPRQQQQQTYSSNQMSTQHQDRQQQYSQHSSQHFQHPQHQHQYQHQHQHLHHQPFSQQPHHDPGAQPVDLSGHFGPAEEMDLDS
ncbi:hypothetical protein BCV70DRAFT_237718 [Testicularia cyperi]|uniref:Uncharacterized protein n=1 Tax=Testicularia cyperi TaxID=1882483 RepID=A0A317XNH9_9BASI|nr:hypothetical protein BCV70DRAFT_237718 [Testicularia cyperi]